MEPREDLDEGRLARPVLAEKAVDFAVADSETTSSSAFTPPKLLVSRSIRRTGNIRLSRVSRFRLARALVQLPQLAISVDIGVAVACIHLGRLAGSVRVVLVEDQERDLRVLDRWQSAKHPHLGV